MKKTISNMEKMELMDELQVHYKDFVKRMKGRVSYDDYETQSLLEGYTEELASFISKELDKAREEGRMSVIQELLFEPEEPSHNISTLEAAFKYEDIIKRYSEEWRNKTKLISPKYIKSKLKQ